MNKNSKHNHTLSKLLISWQRCRTLRAPGMPPHLRKSVKRESGHPPSISSVIGMTTSLYPSGTGIGTVNCKANSCIAGLESQLIKRFSERWWSWDAWMKSESLLFSYLNFVSTLMRVDVIEAPGTAIFDWRPSFVPIRCAAGRQM